MPNVDIINQVNQIIDSFVEKHGYAPNAIELESDELQALVCANFIHGEPGSFELKFRGIPVRASSG